MVFISFVHGIFSIIEDNKKASFKIDEIEMDFRKIRFSLYKKHLLSL